MINNTAMNPTSTRSQTSRHKQRGAASLLISLTILTLLTIITLYTSKNILTEQKISNNDYRTRQAFEAAEAGIAAVLANLRTNMDNDNDGFVDGTAGDATTAPAGIFDSDGNDSRDSKSLAVGSTSATVVLNDISSSELTIIEVQSTGRSADKSATRTITRTFVIVDPIPNAPENPLTTKGTVTLAGSANVHNSEGHSTIWSGGDVNLSNASTRIPDVAAANYPGCMDNPDVNPCATVSISQQSVMGLDVIEFDSSIGNLSSAQLFENFFGRSMASFKDKFVDINTTPANAPSDISLQTEKAIWIDGSGGATTTLNGTTVGCTVAVNGNTCTLANRKPSILIIDGNATLAGNATFYGVVFVTGNLNITGNTTIVGAIIAAGAVTGTTGSLDVYYNSNVINNLTKIGELGASAGSWRDI